MMRTGASMGFNLGDKKGPKGPNSMRWPEEKGLECLEDMQLNMLKYFNVIKMKKQGFNILA